MEPVFAIHEHELKPDCDIEQYEKEVGAAVADMIIPGLMGAYFLKGFKGERSKQYAVIWIFENEEAINNNFGTLDNPKWPEKWLVYENEILAKYLICHPDKINFTDYKMISSSEKTGHTDLDTLTFQTEITKMLKKDTQLMEDLSDR